MLSAIFIDRPRLSLVISIVITLAGLIALVFATGAAMLSRRGVGTAVFGGMIAAAAIGIFVIPPLYVVFQWLREKVKGPRGAPQPEPAFGHAPAAAE